MCLLIFICLFNMNTSLALLHDSYLSSNLSIYLSIYLSMYISISLSVLLRTTKTMSTPNTYERSQLKRRRKKIIGGHFYGSFPYGTAVLVSSDQTPLIPPTTCTKIALRQFWHAGKITERQDR